MLDNIKYCEFCGNKVYIDAVICPRCGRQIEEMKIDKNNNQPFVINNVNSINGVVVHNKKECDKWISFLLCFFLGIFGAHKFYEGKTGLVLLYLFTVGLFGIGWFVDLITILCKPNPYYV